ncbi:MAG: hypothetical protein ACPGNV_18135 [Mangrovicoccus sp.]
MVELKTPNRNQRAARRGQIISPPRWRQPNGIRGLVGWYEARANKAALDGGGNVTALENLVTGGQGLQALPDGGGPQYVAADHDYAGRPSLAWPHTLTRQGLELAGETAVREVYCVMQYRDGQQATFADNTTVAADHDGGADYILVGGGGTSNLLANAFAVPFELRVNGELRADYRILPLPVSIVRFTASVDWLIASVGAKNYGGPRSWQGSIGAVLAFTRNLTEGEDRQVRGWLGQRFGVRDAI